jgi:O-antigen ligase
MNLLIAIIVALVPVVMAPNLFLYFETLPKAAVILIGVGVLLLNLRRFEPGIAKLAASRLGRVLILGITAQIVSLFVSSCFSPDKVLSFLGTGWRRLGSIEYAAVLLLCLLVAAWYADNFARLVSLFRAICISGIVTTSYGILQYLGWDPFADAARYSVAYGDLSIVRPPSTVGHAVYFADYLVVLIFISVGLATWESSRSGRSLALLVALMAIVALLLTGTRAGIVGLLAGGIFLFIRIRPAITRKRIILTAVFIGILGALCFTPVGEQLEDRWAQWRDDAKGGTRPLLWRDCFEMARVHLVLGSGPELFATEFPKYQSIELARAFPEYYNESTHNVLLDALLSQGVPGLIICLILGSVGIVASFQWKKHRTVGAALAAGLVGLFVSEQFSPFVLTTVLFFYLIVAVLVAGSFEPSAGAGDGSIVVKVLGLVAIPFSALLILVGLQIIHIDVRWAAIQRAVRAGRIEGAMSEYGQVERLFPPESGANLWYSRALTEAAGSSLDATLRQRVWIQALEAASRATEVSEDRHNAYYNLAVFYFTQGDLTHSEQTLRTAIDYAPHWYKPHWLLAEVFLLSGKLDSAAGEAQKAIDYNGQSRWELQDTLRRIRIKQSAGAN